MGAKGGKLKIGKVGEDSLSHEFKEEIKMFLPKSKDLLISRFCLIIKRVFKKGSSLPSLPAFIITLVPLEGM